VNTYQYGDPADRICKTCDTSCKTCSTSSTSCTSCYSPNYLSLTTCVATCPSPTFGNNGTRTCGNTCENTNEYEDTSTRVCRACNTLCKTCTTTATTCTSCNSPYYLSGSTCVTTCTSPNWGINSTRSCLSTCANSNEFGDTTNYRICSPCHSTCATCSGTATNCLTCISPRYKSGSLCVIACPSPTFGNNNTRQCASSCSNTNEYGDLSDNRICKTCNSNCLTCITTSTQCLSCASPMFLSSSTCVTACPSPTVGNNGTRSCAASCTNPNEYADISDNRICKTCDGTCATCSGTATSCLKCSSPRFLSDSSCVIACPDPTVGNNGTRACAASCTNSNEYPDLSNNRICKTCTAICATCSISAGNCLSCNTGKYLNSNTCLTACPIPLWGNNLTRTCDSTCAQSIQFGDASDNRICKTCDPTCLTCLGTASTCLTCASPRYLQGSTCVTACSSPNWGNNDTRTCSSLCSFNQYGDTSDKRICKTCDPNCLTCESSSKTCLSCAAPLYLSLSSCTAICPFGKLGNNNTRTCDNSCSSSNQYGDPLDRICKNCDHNCATCSGTSTTCLSCSSPLFLEANACVARCSEPKLGNNGTLAFEATCTLSTQYGDPTDRICKNCDPLCKTCQNHLTTCTSCYSPYFLSSTTCVLECPNSKFGNNATRTCDDTCANSNEFGDLSDKRICKNCDLLCLTCTGLPKFYFNYILKL
jgi:hypothetical protein